MRSRLFTDVTTSRNYRNAWITSPVQNTNEDYTSVATRTTRRDQMFDVVTPKFYSVRNQGGIICSPMYRETLYHDIDETVVDQTGRYGSIAIRQVYHKSNLLGSSLPSVAAQGVSALDALYAQFSRETNLAITRAHAEVDVSEMQLLASIGELPETLRWMLSLVQRGVKVTRAFRKKADTARVLRTLKYNAFDSSPGQVQKRLIQRYESFVKVLAARKQRYKDKNLDKSVVDDFSGLWLEYRYAIRPLISDMQNALKALRKTLDDKRYTARGKELSAGESESIKSELYIGTSQNIQFTARIKEEEKVKARGGVLYTLHTELLSMFEILGLDQPIESLYELIPFSFILDWFFSIGDLLAAWLKSSDFNILTSWVTLMVERTTSTHITNVQIFNKNGYIWDGSRQVELGSSHLTAMWKWRVPSPPLPLIPSFDLKLNLAKIIDLGMIGRALLGGSVPAVVKRS